MVFLATNAKENELRDLERRLSGVQIVRYTPPEDGAFTNQASERAAAPALTVAFTPLTYLTLLTLHAQPPHPSPLSPPSPPFSPW